MAARGAPKSYSELLVKVQNLIDREIGEDDLAVDTASYADLLDLYVSETEAEFYATEASHSPPFEAYIEWSMNDSDDYLEIPGDFNGVKRVEIIAADGNISFIAVEGGVDDIRENKLAGLGEHYPTMFAIDGNRIWLPSFSGEWTFRMFYYRVLDDVANVDSENENHYLLHSLYEYMIYGTAERLAVYFDMDQHIAKYGAMANRRIAMLTAQFDRERRGKGRRLRKSRNAYRIRNGRY